MPEMLLEYSGSILNRKKGITDGIFTMDDVDNYLCSTSKNISEGNEVLW